MTWDCSCDARMEAELANVKDDDVAIVHARDDELAVGGKGTGGK